MQTYRPPAQAAGHRECRQGSHRQQFRSIVFDSPCMSPPASHSRHAGATKVLPKSSLSPPPVRKPKLHTPRGQERGVTAIIERKRKQRQCKPMRGKGKRGGTSTMDEAKERLYKLSGEGEVRAQSSEHRGRCYTNPGAAEENRYCSERCVIITTSCHMYVI